MSLESSSMSSESSSSLVMGFGDEIIFTSVTFLVIGFVGVTVAHLFKRRNAATGPNAEQPSPEITGNIQRRVENTSSDVCAICLDEYKLAIETNCGHMYCGICFKTMYDINYQRALTCPSCRQKINLLFLHLTQEESDAPSNSELAVNRSSVLDIFNHYNQSHSTIDRSIMDHLRDLPALLRNLWFEFFTINGVLRFRFRVRIGFYCSILLFYLCIPFDIIPESIFGLLGFMDDLLVSFVFFIYLAALYRRHILDRH